MNLRDKNKNITSEEDVDFKAKNISGIDFFRTEFPDGTIFGATEFRHQKMHLFEVVLERTK